MANNKFANDVNSTPIFTKAAAMALALALNLPLKGKGIDIINFLPLGLKRKEMRAARRLIIMVTTIVLISLLALSSLGIFISSRAVRAAIKKVAANLNEITSIADTLKNLSQRDKTIKQESAQIQELVSRRPDFYLPLVSLAKAVPQEVFLTRVSIAKTGAPEANLSAETYPVNTIPQASGGPTSTDTDKIEIKAEAFADYETTEHIVKHMRANLEATAHFKNIQITPLKLEKISPRATSDASKALSLTQPMRRTFTVTADIIPSPLPSPQRDCAKCASFDG
jgi:Tfp pilus assembly protein PilN